MKFCEVAQYFERLGKTGSRLEMAKILHELFSKTPLDDIQNLIYFCKGNIGPVYKGKEINIGQATLISIISLFIGQTQDSVKEKYSKLGDLGLVIESSEIKKKQSILFSKELSFQEVYSTFEKIASIEGKGTIEKKIKLFEYILFNSDIISAKYIVRFPIAFRLGFSDSTIIDALSFLDESYDQKEARKIISDKYDIISDLGLLAKKVKENGIDSIKDLGIQPFIPIKSALCERAKNLDEIKERLSGEENKPFLVDSKIDGFRQQIHKFGDVIKIFSRNQEDMTAMFPDVVKEIKKIPKDFIIDCEAIAYDEKNKKYHNFQITIQRKRKYDISRKSKELPLHLKVFDVLYYDGKEYINTSNLERRKLVEKHFNYPPIIQPTELLITNDLKKLEEFFKSRLEMGLEGVVVKDIDSTYRAGSRGFNWIKYKKSYNSLTDTIDAVIVGGFYGQGKRSDKGIGALLMAIYDDSTDKYYTIAKLGSGLTDDILTELSTKLNSLKLPTINNLVTNLKPDFYVNPKIVVEINYDEITNSSVHTVCYNRETKQGLALRFPRLVRFRTDKLETQTTSPDEIKRLYNLQ